MKSVHTLCVFNESKDPQYRDLGSLFLQDRNSEEGWALEYVESLAAFQSVLKTKPLSLLIFIFTEKPSQALLDLISKSRNLTHLRETEMVSIHKRSSAEGLQKTLMMGVKTLFSEPIEKKLILHRLRVAAEWTRPAVLVGTDFEKREQVAFLGEVFGRVGKILLSPLGDMQVETDLRFPDGRLVVMRSMIAKDLAMAKFHFHVAATTLEDTYYHYGYSYRLTLDADAILRSRLKSWIEGHQDSCFAQPKTKVLWVGDHLSGEVENIFDKSIFSVHVEKPGRATPAFLSRMNPKVLILGEIPEPTLRAVQAWLEGKPHGDRVVFTTVRGHPPGWIRLHDISPEAFKATFLTLVRPFLQRRLESSLESARYLSRKSDYSRCAFPIEGKVLRSSDAHVELELDYIIDKGCIFLAHKPVSAYLKVVHVEAFLNKGTFHVICEHVPFSGKGQPLLPPQERVTPSSELELAPAPAAKGGKTPAEPSFGTRDKIDLFFLQPKTVWLDLGKILLGLLGIAGVMAVLYWVLPKTEIQAKDPAAMGDVFRSIRDAFR